MHHYYGKGWKIVVAKKSFDFMRTDGEECEPIVVRDLSEDTDDDRGALCEYCSLMTRNDLDYDEALAYVNLWFTGRIKGE